MDVSGGRLTPLERLIERSDINVAECIKAIGGLVLRGSLGIAVIAGALSDNGMTVGELARVALQALGN